MKRQVRRLRRAVDALWDEFDPEQAAAWEANFELAASALVDLGWFEGLYGATVEPLPELLAWLGAQDEDALPSEAQHALAELDLDELASDAARVLEAVQRTGYGGAVITYPGEDGEIDAARERVADHMELIVRRLEGDGDA
mgnify:CR=1 FL=1